MVMTSGSGKIVKSVLSKIEKIIKRYLFQKLKWDKTKPRFYFPEKITMPRRLGHSFNIVKPQSWDIDESFCTIICCQISAWPFVSLWSPSFTNLLIYGRLQCSEVLSVPTRWGNLSCQGQRWRQLCTWRWRCISREIITYPVCQTRDMDCCHRRPWASGKL